MLFVNPRRIESSGPDTGDVLLIKPDTDFYFLAAMLHEIVFRIGYDRTEVEKYARNVDGLLEFVRRYPAALGVFNARGLDTCCGGGLPVVEAAARHGLDLAELLAALEQVAAEPAR